MCLLLRPRGVPIPQAAQAATQWRIRLSHSLRCCLGRLGDRAAPWGYKETRNPSTPTHCRVHPSSSGPALAAWGRGTPHRGMRRHPPPPESGGYSRVPRLGVDGLCVYSYPHKLSRSPKWPRQDRTHSRVSIAVWEDRIHTLYSLGSPLSMNVRRERRSVAARSSRSGWQWSPLCRWPLLRPHLPLAPPSVEPRAGSSGPRTVQTPRLYKLSTRVSPATFGFP